MKKTPIFWFTGLSGSGKTTIVERVSKILLGQNKKIKIYDGDVVRKKMTRHLTFSPSHIEENNRVIAELCRKDCKKYDYIFVPIISPFLRSRKRAKEIIGDPFYLIYVKASLDEVVKRDAKGLYKKALAGKIKDFIGVSKNVPYQAPRNADLVLDTENEDIESSVNRLLCFINSKDSARKKRA